MDRDSVYKATIFPLMDQIIQLCKQHQISFAAQFMVDERNGYISAIYRGPGKKHISTVVEKMLFEDM